MDLYTHVGRIELAEALDVLPDVSSTGAETARKTGTDGEETVTKWQGIVAKSVLPECLPEFSDDECISTQYGAPEEGLSGVCKEGENSEGHSVESVLAGSDANGPGGIRTPDQAIMSRRL